MKEEAVRKRIKELEDEISLLRKELSIEPYTINTEEWPKRQEIVMQYLQDITEETLLRRWDELKGSA